MKTLNRTFKYRGALLATGALGLLAFLSLAPMAQAATNADPIKIAKALDIPGKHHTDQCQRFADELFNRLDAAGIEAYKVTFDWESYNVGARTRSGAHMFVVFKDSHGRYYGMDNLALRPVWLQGDSPSEWSQFFAGMDMGTNVADSVASRAAQNLDENTFVASR
ncbi:MAG: hypothetical protein PHD76_03460 [Methylacidiphilales bacterium]|nr:hypothetical protein [Candidatus Methylacidiphilales bacterium]